jgi:cobyrinic acid a,c-diamide synthase
MVNIPRVVIAAPASGHGKTSVATGLMSAFRTRGLAVSGHKVGPDYIDPGYHALAAGRPGRNLDPWLVDEHRVAPMFLHGATTPTQADIAVIEGVMGLFDGASGRGSFASTAHVAALLGAPVVLVVDATGMGRSVAAVVHGFTTFDPSLRIAGVILNRVGSTRHADILTEGLVETGVPVLGTIRRQDILAIPSRHLGLVPAGERIIDAERTVAALGEIVASSVDLEAVMRVARTVTPLSTGDRPTSSNKHEKGGPSGRPPRVAIAGGSAFTFGYTEQVELLAGAGAEVVSFDPVHDERLPDGVDGLVIGGGFPEAHAAALSANQPMREGIAELAGAGVPIAAECAGLLYLAKTLDGAPMCGVLDAAAAMTDRLTLGYREATASIDSVLVAAGTRVRGHEFHRTSCQPAAGGHPAWQWRAGEQSVSEGVVRGRIHASYLHLHWAGSQGIADRFVAGCLAGRAARSVAS